MWLYLHPDTEYGVSDLAGRLGVPLSTLHREVVRLDGAALIVSRTLGRNRLIRANVDHPAAKALTQLLEVTFGPRAVIAEEFAIPGAKQVVIFGSWAARYAGEAGPPLNDIDVLVVGKVDRADVYEAADRASARLDIEVNPVVRSAKQWSVPEDALVKQIKTSAHTELLDRFLTDSDPIPRSRLMTPATSTCMRTSRRPATTWRHMTPTESRSLTALGAVLGPRRVATALPT